MASYLLLLALSGYRFDALESSLGFEPKIALGNLKCFLSTNTGWKEFSREAIENLYIARIRVLQGKIKINIITPQKFRRLHRELEGDYCYKRWGRKISVIIEDGRFIFPERIKLSHNEELSLERF